MDLRSQRAALAPMLVLLLSIAGTAAVAQDEAFDLQPNDTLLTDVDERMKPPKPPKHRVDLEIEQPGSKGVSFLTEAGAPLILKMKINDELGIGMRGSSREFPVLNDTGWVVWDDPDGCLSFQLGSGCPVDETLFEFTTGFSLPGVGDNRGNLDRRLAMVDGGEFERPHILVWSEAAGANQNPEPIGPPTGGDGGGTEFRCRFESENLGAPCTIDADCPMDSVCIEAPISMDGYGYGADDDGTGLVILAESEAGMVFDPATREPVVPKQLRNLAGFVNMVSYELDSTGGQTVLSYAMAQPQSLFGPLYTWDNCIDDGAGCPCIGPVGTTCSAINGLEQLRVNGGPIQEFTSPGDLIDYKNTIRIEVLAFVVNGVAPSTLSDMDGDGDVDEDDAQAAGYTLLSGEETATFQYYHQDEFARGYVVDFDGNGIGPLVAPVSPGTLTPVPRLNLIPQNP